MLDFNSFAPIYDFHLIEKGVQDFFVGLPTGAFVKPPDEDDPKREAWAPGAGSIPFYTPEQALVLQACRPRIGILSTNFSEYPSARFLDADGVYRATGWKATMKFAVISKPSYKEHRALRGAVLAILPQLQPLPTPDRSDVAGTGVNAFLKYHEVGEFAMQSGDTQIKPGDGYYLSIITVNLSFSVRVQAWPGGVLPLPQIPLQVVGGMLMPTVDDTGAVISWPFRDQATGQIAYLRIEDSEITLRAS